MSVQQDFEDDIYLNKSRYRFVKRLVRRICFVLNIDLFLIYKDAFKNSKLARYRSYQLPEVRLTYNQSDKLRARFHIITQILFTYLPLKFVLIAIQTYLGLMRIDLNENTFLMSLFKLFDQLIGKPFNTIPGMSIYLCAAMSVALFNGYIVCPRKYLRDPIQATSLRFLFDFERELSHMDLQIANCIRNFLHVRGEDGEGYEIKSTIVLSQLNNIEKLRPATHNRKYVKQTFDLLLAFISIAIMIGVPLVSILLPVLVVPVATKRICAQKSIQLSNCSLLTAFDVQDLIAYFEILFGLTFGLIIVYIYLVLVGLNIAYQLSLANAIRRDLENCLQVVSGLSKNLNDHYSMRTRKSPELLSVNSNEERMLNLDRRGLRSRFRGRRRYFITSKNLLNKLEISLFRTLIKLIVTQKEIKICANSSGHILESILILMGVCLTSVFISEKLDGEEMQILRTLSLLFILSSTNSILLGCAYVFSRTIEIEKVAWSILACLEEIQSIKQAKDDRLIYGASPGKIAFNERLIGYWIKYVSTYTLSNERNSISSFRVSITYGRTLKINFLGLSLASLMQII